MTKTIENIYKCVSLAKNIILANEQKVCDTLTLLLLFRQEPIKKFHQKIQGFQNHKNSDFKKLIIIKAKSYQSCAVKNKLQLISISFHRLLHVIHDPVISPLAMHCITKLCCS